MTALSTFEARISLARSLASVPTIVHNGNFQSLSVIHLIARGLESLLGLLFSTEGLGGIF